MTDKNHRGTGESMPPPIGQQPAGTPQWHVTACLAPRDGDPALLDSIRELRARILFDRGRRPAFARGDDQNLDFGAWHFIAQREPDGPPLGYIRLSTPATGDLFQSRAYLGAARYEALLRSEGVAARDTFEHSRLVVEHRARKLGLGLYLNAMAIAAAHHLGAKAMIGTSGTKDGQDHFHERFGFRSMPGTRAYVEQYTEDVVVMFHRVADGAGQYAELVDQLRAEFPAVAAAGRKPPASRLSSGRAAPVGLADADCDRGVWQPVLFEPCRASHVDALTALLASGDVREVHDTIDEQLTELVRSREPACVDPIAIQRKKDEQLAGLDAWEYGAWAWYPWSRRLVHVLPREEFRLVRTDRNRGKIERPEQRRLLGNRIGIIGLSVGNSAAVTFALEGIGGAYKLADFDEFSLSNLNRLRAGVHHLGVNKAVISARQMFEIDPYLDIEIYRDGLTEHNIDEFFRGGNGPIDLLVEECDTPWVKIAAREHARDLGVPVVMDCNDRGMLDIERFDHEPDRPLLHGLLGDVKSVDMVDLSRQDKVDLILAMVDADRISPELAASFEQIGHTLSSWPQLASGVALGGALTGEAARRILLGLPCGSGRFYTDLELQLGPERNTVAGSTR
ncbi:ThiF family adenylyltransferase [Kutzneria buriramensis]|uniref:Molybdopterin/thiamine biosynthesis adenylyltransferase n=1 Tax=Kutzneria buriramensis TaxID=1045776 RepID=A0A3E0HK56_9PSEU|nr:ThiF family adenylyltransferase [Kutzneria buriramensis]REH46852.1 molybdopterin/thiamine biosynthesis adenylyltransferase [Kutzneria buriramensis]